VSPADGAPAALPGTPPPPPEAPEVRPARLLLTLGVAGTLSGALLVVAFGLTLPAIEANRAREIDAAVKEVLKAPQRYETLYVVDRALRAALPEGANPAGVERVYVGYGPNDQRIGFAVVSGEAGFQDVVKVIFGYDPKTKKLTGMKVLESKETPGLGDKIEKDPAFVGQFDGAQAPLVGVRKGKQSGPRDIVTITGATISSKAVIRIINNAFERLGPLVDAYPEGGKG
jgi:electron transport complex protein RnfG